MAHTFKQGRTLEVVGETTKEYKERKLKEMTLPQFTMLQKVISLEKKKVLDLGCFHGMMVDLINTKTQANCEGVDINFIGKAPKHCKIYDGKVLPYKDKTFDVVLLIEIVEHLDDINQIFREARRVLKKEGELFLTTPNKYYVSIKDDHQNWKNQIKQFLKLKTRQCIKIYSYFELKRLFKKHGFTFETYGRLKNMPFLRKGFIFKLQKN